MELIEGHAFPKACQLLRGILAATHPVERLQVLILVQHILALAVEFLYLCHIAVAALEDVSHLALMGRSLNSLLFCHLEEGLGCGETDAGEVRPSIQLMCPLDVQSCRTAAMVAFSCWTEGAMPIHGEALQAVAQSFVDVSVIVSCAESQHARPVGTFPPECTCMRSSSHQSEIVHSALAQHLRQLRLVSEVIGQPSHSCHPAKARLEVALSQEERTGQCLA